MTIKCLNENHNVLCFCSTEKNEGKTKFKQFIFVDELNSSFTFTSGDDILKVIYNP